MTDIPAYNVDTSTRPITDPLVWDWQGALRIGIGHHIPWGQDAGGDWSRRSVESYLDRLDALFRGENRDDLLALIRLYAPDGGSDDKVDAALAGVIDAEDGYLYDADWSNHCPDPQLVAAWADAEVGPGFGLREVRTHDGLSGYVCVLEERPGAVAKWSEHRAFHAPLPFVAEGVPS